MLRRCISLAFIAGVSILLLLNYSDIEWRSLRPSTNVGQARGSDEVKIEYDGLGRVEQFDNIDPNAWRDGKEAGHFKEPKVDAKSPYPIGITKPAGSRYTRTLVMPRMRGDNTSWIDEELEDMFESGLLSTAIYTMDDPEASLHPIENKGHEVMAYLSYIIDFYDRLPDIAIFMHSHRYAWHNNLILDKDSSLMIRHLSPERVTREGYMNLRCHWDPGCPDWVHPGEIDRYREKYEQRVFSESWAELFPREQIPARLAQPCCAQFAVSRERILAIPRPRFIWLRDWILHTELDDFLSGRIFEYTWQYIFTSSPLHCPSMSACYCDGFGLCFGDPQEFDHYFELMHNLNEYELKLQRWTDNANAVAVAHERAKDGRLIGDEEFEVPELGLHGWLTKEIAVIGKEMQRRRSEAFERGRDPAQRAKEAGREWKDGDGF